ncbi:dipeptide/oligopeptide/nickel ABC transporter permease/ATP-binding protein [Phycicoccus endophyticus]|uniref:Dipeptide/oligopeptide/nickel ABC transporter permease/ATP-binding protein n=1 Tax=Phycicoccus endophyticus TaxID=1690220 RepID=A0A7G9QZQ9_9MICO|nr:dipeptide/oligopeptide/nickel ABC transporter permease/ATP-binding protein [Phycicoccus endophyticus]NHI20029.1 dipeptide/oligopeptide/nickel ABC transporter permease/ATP-binding protein [Phycicoccus endophyticus]QNN48834.1 dipeptide/oligopeptide/nickel ABC transporter permease/ATP-binding protein [Phycicoccus endophyticus]GGL42460.1 peptide ABC transporter ATP-binding protein [Phycicoccus endophyticus]
MSSLALPVEASDGPRRRRLHPILVTGILLMALLTALAVLAPPLFGHAATTLTSDSRLAPSAQHLLGTDEFGRDLFARALVATRLTLVLTATATALSVVIGVSVGTTIWMAPERVRRAVLGVNAVAVAFPSLVLALVIAAVLGAGAWPATLAIGIAGCPAFVRLSANMAAPIVTRDYVSTARRLGVPGPLVILRHVLPNMAEPMLVLVASCFAVTMMELSGLSFVGLGVQEPDFDFGKLLSDGLVSIYTQPSQVVGPSVMLVLTGLAAMLIGDGLAASSNPRTRSRTRSSGPTGRLRPSGRPAVPPADPEATVSVRGLRVHSAAGVELVKGVSFDVAPGEVLGIVGESGSGKSLTAMSLAGLVPESTDATADALWVAGHDLLAPVPPAALARDVALVYQDPVSSFNPALRLGTQLTEVARTHLGMSRGAARRALVDRLRRLKITEPERRTHQHPHELSGGMLQRAMIASSLLTEARLLIADEATSALDVTVQVEVLRRVVAVSRSVGASVLFISHDLGVVRAMCDRVLVLYRGEAVEELSADALEQGRVSHRYTRRLLEAAEYVEAIR